VTRAFCPTVSLADLFADSPATADSFSRFAQHRPIPYESSPVPADHRFWQNEKECFFPSGPEAECHDPLVRTFRSRRGLMLENLALRQQLAVLKRKHPRPKLGPLDKLFWLRSRAETGQTCQHS
jgi:hypothetical protein